MPAPELGQAWLRAGEGGVDVALHSISSHLCMRNKRCVTNLNKIKFKKRSVKFVTPTHSFSAIPFYNFHSMLRKAKLKILFVSFFLKEQ